MLKILVGLALIPLVLQGLGIVLSIVFGIIGLLLYPVIWIRDFFRKDKDNG